MSLFYLSIYNVQCVCVFCISVHLGLVYEHVHSEVYSLTDLYLIVSLYREFGAKVINVKVLLKALPSVFVHTDKNVRAEVRHTLDQQMYYVTCKLHVQTTRQSC